MNWTYLLSASEEKKALAPPLLLFFLPLFHLHFLPLLIHRWPGGRIVSKTGGEKSNDSHVIANEILVGPPFSRPPFPTILFFVYLFIV